MFRRQIKPFLAGLFVTLMLGTQALAQPLQSRPNDTCESTTLKTTEIGLIDRETVARAEERIDALRAKLFDLEIREMDLLARLEDLDDRLSPEGIQRALMFVASPRPMDEFREALRIRLESQKARVNRQLELLTENRERLESAIREAEAELERLRQR
jgi:hypothetical protein